MLPCASSFLFPLLFCHHIESRIIKAENLSIQFFTELFLFMPCMCRSEWLWYEEENHPIFSAGASKKIPLFMCFSLGWHNTTEWNEIYDYGLKWKHLHRHDTTDSALVSNEWFLSFPFIRPSIPLERARWKMGKYSSLLLFVAIELSNIVEALRVNEKTYFMTRHSILVKIAIVMRPKWNIGKFLCNIIECRYFQVPNSLVSLRPPGKYISKQFLWHKLIINGRRIDKVFALAQLRWSWITNGSNQFRIVFCHSIGIIF